jgi:hypothetical protein
LYIPAAGDALGSDGGVLSIVRIRAGEGRLVFPAASVALAVIE